MLHEPQASRTTNLNTVRRKVKSFDFSDLQVLLACERRHRRFQVAKTTNVYGRGAAEEFLGDALSGRERSSYVLRPSSAPSRPEQVDENVAASGIEPDGATLAAIDVAVTGVVER